jgi:hypothetical protein
METEEGISSGYREKDSFQKLLLTLALLGWNDGNAERIIYFGRISVAF